MRSPQPSPCSSRGPWNGYSSFPHSLAPVSQCSTLRKEPPSVVLGAPPQLEKEKIPSGIPALMTIPMQMPLQAAIPGCTPSFTCITYPLLQPTMPKTPEVVTTSMFPPRLSQLDWKISYFLCRRE